MREFPPGTYFTAKSTEAMRIKCLAQGHNILMLLGFDPSISVPRNRHHTHMNNMLKNVCIHYKDGKMLQSRIMEQWKTGSIQQTEIDDLNIALIQ